MYFIPIIIIYNIKYLIITKVENVVQINLWIYPRLEKGQKRDLVNLRLKTYI